MVDKKKRIRLSGRDRFDNANINCYKCGVSLIKAGMPQTPLYYAIDGEQYCPRCQGKV